MNSIYGNDDDELLTLFGGIGAYLFLFTFIGIFTVQINVLAIARCGWTFGRNAYKLYPYAIILYREMIFFYKQSPVICTVCLRQLGLGENHEKCYDVLAGKKEDKPTPRPKGGFIIPD